MSDRVDLSDLPKDRGARLDLALALLRRERRWSDGASALKQRYPEAPDEMIRTATHHLYGDLPDTAVDLLACIELSLRETQREVGGGAVYHALDHLYNWLQFQALLPDGRPGLLELIALAEELAKDDDKPALLSTLEELRQNVEGNRNAPDFGTT